MADRDIKVEREAKMRSVLRRVELWEKEKLKKETKGYFVLNEQPDILIGSLERVDYLTEGVSNPELVINPAGDNTVVVRISKDALGHHEVDFLKKKLNLKNERKDLRIVETNESFDYHFELGISGNIRNLRRNFHDWVVNVVCNSPVQMDDDLGSDFFRKLYPDQIRFDALRIDNKGESEMEKIELSGLEVKTTILNSKKDLRSSQLWEQMMTFMGRLMYNEPLFRGFRMDGIMLCADSYIKSKSSRWRFVELEISACHKVMMFLKRVMPEKFLDDNLGYEDLIKSAVFPCQLPTEDSKTKNSMVTEELFEEWTNYSENLDEKNFYKKEDDEIFKFVVNEAAKKIDMESKTFNPENEKKLVDDYVSSVNANGDKKKHKCLFRFPLLCRKSKEINLKSEEEIVKEVIKRSKESGELETDEAFELMMLMSLADRWKKKNFEFKPEDPDKKEVRVIKEAVLSVGGDDVTVKTNTVGEMRKEMGSSRHTYKRTDFDDSIFRNPDVYKYFTRHGLSDKKFRLRAEESVTKAIKENSKKPLAYDSDISCVKRFMELDLSQMRIGEIDRKTSESIAEDKRANGGIRSRGSLIYEAVHKSKLSESLEIVGVIMNEIAASYRQFTKSDTWVVKRLKNENIVIMTKVFTMEKPAICKLLWTDDYEMFYRPCCVFDHSTKVFTIDKWRCTEAESARRYLNPLLRVFWELDKDVSDRDLLSKSKKHSKMVENIRVKDGYNELPEEISSHICKTYNESSFTKKHTLYCIAMKLESKKTSANIAFQARYMYMKVLSDNNEKISVMDNLIKLPVRLTSALGLFTVRGLISAFWKMYSRRPHRKRVLMDEESLQDEFTNLYSFVSREKIQTFEQVINLSYLGCVQNKIGGVGVVQDLQILDKTVTEEYILLDDFKHRKEKIIEKGEEDQYINAYGAIHKDKLNCGDLKTKHKMLKKHNMNARILLVAAKDTLRTINQDKLKSRNEILETLYKLNNERPDEKLTTLKSSCIRPSDYSFNPSISAVVREKLIIAFQRWFAKEKKAGKIQGDMPRIPDLAEMILTSEDWHPMVNMFMKAQHGTVREILVSTLDSRMVQLYLENIGRAMCKSIAVETLTFGSKKMMFLKNHQREVKEVEKNNEYSATYNFNDVLDCTTWCQSFIMAVFMIVCLGMMGREIAKTFCYAMNRFTDKKVIVPHSVLKNFTERPEIDSTFKSINRLKRDFLGIEESGIMNKGEICFTNESNMFQGFMHYNSSAAGAVIDVIHEKYGRRYLDNQLKMNETENLKDKGNRLERKDVIVVRHGAVSSDDRTSLWSVIIINKKKDTVENVLLLSRYMQIVSRMLEPLLNAMTIRVSDQKSARNMSEISEFNQNYSISGSEIRAAIKIIGPCVNVPAVAGFLSQSRNFHETLKDCRSFGMTAVSCMIVSLEQSELSLTLRGCDVEHDEDRLQDIYDHLNPLIGSNILEPEMFSGLFGFNFARYNLMKRDKNFCMEMAACFKSMPDEFRAMDDKTYDSTISVDFNPGSNLRYIKFIEKIKKINAMTLGSEDIDKEIQAALKDDSVVFSRSWSLKNAQTRMIQKSFGQGIKESMKESDSIRVLSASVYLAKQCVCKISETEEKIVESVEEIAEELESSQSEALKKLLANSDNYTRIRKISIVKSTIRWFCKVILDRYKESKDEESKKWIQEDKLQRENQLPEPANDVFEGCDEIIRLSFWDEQRSLFEMIMDIIERENSKEIEDKKFRSVKKVTKIMLKKVDLKVTNLLEICVKAWNNEIENEDDEENWREVKEKYPFIRNTYQETVKVGRFQNANELKNFLFRVSPKDYSVGGVFRGYVSGEPTRDTWEKILMLNYGHNVRLKSSRHRQKEKKIMKMLSSVADAAAEGIIELPLIGVIQLDISKTVDSLEQIFESNESPNRNRVLESWLNLDLSQRLALDDSIMDMFRTLEIFDHDFENQNEFLRSYCPMPILNEKLCKELFATKRNPKDSFKRFVEYSIRSEASFEYNELMKCLPKVCGGWLKPEKEWNENEMPSESENRSGWVLVKIRDDLMVAEIEGKKVKASICSKTMRNYGYTLIQMLISLGVESPYNNNILKKKIDKENIANFDINQVLSVTKTVATQVIEVRAWELFMELIKKSKLRINEMSVSVLFDGKEIFRRYFSGKTSLNGYEIQFRNYMCSERWIKYANMVRELFIRGMIKNKMKVEERKKIIPGAKKAIELYLSVLNNLFKREGAVDGAEIMDFMILCCTEESETGKLNHLSFKVLKWLLDNLRSAGIVKQSLSEMKNRKDQMYSENGWDFYYWTTKDFEFTHEGLDLENEVEEKEELDFQAIMSGNIWDALRTLDLKSIINKPGVMQQKKSKDLNRIAKFDFSESISNDKISKTTWVFRKFGEETKKMSLYINILGKLNYAGALKLNKMVKSEVQGSMFLNHVLKSIPEKLRENEREQIMESLRIEKGLLDIIDKVLIQERAARIRERIGRELGSGRDPKIKGLVITEGGSDYEFGKLRYSELEMVKSDKTVKIKSEEANLDSGLSWADLMEDDEEQLDDGRHHKEISDYEKLYNIRLVEPSSITHDIRMIQAEVEYLYSDYDLEEFSHEIKVKEDDLDEDLKVLVSWGKFLCYDDDKAKLLLDKLTKLMSSCTNLDQFKVLYNGIIPLVLISQQNFRILLRLSSRLKTLMSNFVDRELEKNTDPKELLNLMSEEEFGNVCKETALSLIESGDTKFETRGKKERMEALEKIVKEQREKREKLEAENNDNFDDKDADFSDIMKSDNFMKLMMDLPPQIMSDGEPDFDFEDDEDFEFYSNIESKGEDFDFM